MEYRPLGKTGLQVSTIGLGCAYLGHLGFEEGVRLVERALDLGITFLDAARAYNDSELKIGQAIKGRRDKVILSTKTATRTRDEARRQIEESLQRLGTDYVDNCHLHGLEDEADIAKRCGPGGALEALLRAKEEGLIRHIGCTAHTSAVLLQALVRYDFETILVPMNIVERDPLRALIPLCQKRGVGVTIMKPVGTGLLPARLALKWLMQQPIATAVPGVSTLAEVELNAATWREGSALSAAEEAEIAATVQRLDHVRCRICGDCLPCPQEIPVPIALGTDVMYNEYRNMGRAAFVATAWSREVVERDLPRREQLIARIESCDHCGVCVTRCPHGLPAPEMLERMLPGLRDMVAIYQEQLSE
jgi:hypothetical protein